ncbi:YcaO-like family protein [Nonomuraea sp. NPDC052116]|uniref:YcaO-like family protein n=1 Tax=Nonomuraea sp. NPDC052116 TaxID=3155665 RepID=UPI003418F9AC
MVMPAGPEQALEQALVSARTGPVFEVTEHAPHTHGGADWLVIASGVAVDRLHGAYIPTSGAGRSPHKAWARRNALYECAERLALREPPGRGPAPAGPDCPLAGRTIPVRDLASGTMLERPAGDFYLHPPPCPRAAGPDRPTSNGAAAGDSYWSAVERGLLELLERDALMTTWRFGLRPPRLPADDLVPDQVEALRGQGLTLTLADLSPLHDLPTVVSVAGGQVDGHQVRTVGSAADRTLRRAAARAAVEAGSVHQVAAERLRLGRHEELTFADFIDHAFYYLDPDKARLLDLLDSGPVTTARAAAPGDDSKQNDSKQDDSEQNVRALAERLARGGVALHVADITPAWLRPHGIHTIVARSPDLYPLELGPGSPDLARRLRRHPAREALVSGRPVNLAPIPLA